MSRARNVPTEMEVVEPPRDGEFFFEDGSAGTTQERQDGARTLACLLGRHPYVSVGLAAVTGMIVASALLNL